MATCTIGGTTIAYELIGEGRPFVLTPGGRFSMDVPGIRELGSRSPQKATRCSSGTAPTPASSDVCFRGRSESEMQADALAGLLRELNLAPAVIVGGSGGSRVSLLTAARHPDVAAQLAML